MKTAIIAILVLACATWQTLARTVVVKGRILNADGLDQLEENCISELNLDREKMVRLNKQRTPPEDDTEFCDFTFCSFKKIGLMNEDGDIDYEALENYILEVIKSERPVNPASMKMFQGILSSSIGECRKNVPTGTNHGQFAIKTMLCITTNMQEALRRML